MESHVAKMVSLLKDEYETAKGRLEDEYWFGRYTLAKQCLLAVEPLKENKNGWLCIGCDINTKNCEACFAGN